MNLFNKPAPYRLIVRPDDVAREKAGLLNQRIARTFLLKMEEDLAISLAEFTATMEEFSIMSNWLLKSFRDVEAFPMVINNLSGIAPSQIHLRVQYSGWIGLLRHRLNRLSEVMESYQLPGLKQPGKWQMPIVTAVPPNQYSTIMLHLSKTEIQLETLVKSIVVERRDAEYGCWQPVQRISLAGLEMGIPMSLNSCMKQETSHLYFW